MCKHFVYVHFKCSCKLINFLFNKQILHRICYIAEVLLSLQQVGNVKYIGWSLQVPCSAESHLIVKSLQSLIVTMENELMWWKKTIKSMRDDFYELNYYTTSQLLMLRQALMKLKLGDSVTLNEDILALLHSIHPQIDFQSVKNAIKLETDKSGIMPIDKLVEIDKVIGLEADSERTEQDKQHTEAVNSFQLLTEENLSNVQKEIMTFIVNQICCKRELVLKVFQDHFSEEKSKHYYLELCTRYQNNGNYDISDDNSVTSSEESVSIISEDDEEMIITSDEGPGL